MNLYCYQVKEETRQNKLVIMKDQFPGYVFGYGSLMSPESIEESLDRKIQLTDLIPCQLHGYIRRWNACVPYIFEDEASGEFSIDVVFLNLERREYASVNGVLLPVNQVDLDALDRRELVYNRLIVTSQVCANQPVQGVVYTYVAQPEYSRKVRLQHGLIMSDYIELVEAACREFGEEFLKEYHRTTLMPESPTFQVEIDAE